MAGAACGAAVTGEVTVQSPRRGRQLGAGDRSRPDADGRGSGQVTARDRRRSAGRDSGCATSGRPMPGRSATGALGGAGPRGSVPWRLRGGLRTDRGRGRDRVVVALSAEVTAAERAAAPEALRRTDGRGGVEPSPAPGTASAVPAAPPGIGLLPATEAGTIVVLGPKPLARPGRASSSDAGAPTAASRRTVGVRVAVRSSGMATAASRRTAGVPAAGTVQSVGHARLCWCAGPDSRLAARRIGAVGFAVGSVGVASGRAARVWAPDDAATPSEVDDEAADPGAAADPDDVAVAGVVAPWPADDGADGMVGDVDDDAGRVDDPTAAATAGDEALRLAAARADRRVGPSRGGSGAGGGERGQAGCAADSGRRRGAGSTRRDGSRRRGAVRGGRIRSGARWPARARPGCPDASSG